MTSKERIGRIFNHQEADRVPITDSPWAGTLARWKKEGMPADIDWRDYLNVDKIESIRPDISPRYEKKIIEETEDYTIATTEWGVTLKSFKVLDSTPEFLGYKINTPQKWEEAKKRMTISRDRINWDRLKKVYPLWKKEGRWVQGIFWFGYDVLHSHMAGTETTLIAMLEDPDWFSDMVNTYLDSSIAHFNMIWDEGYHFDSMFWYDDMGYKLRTFFSEELYVNLLKPVHKRAIDWAHDRGIKTHLHSCGNIMPFVPHLVEIGLDALNPIEIKAGMDIKYIKKNYGDKLVLHGGIDALLLDKKEKVIPYIEELVPMLKEKGGYIFSSDHSIPNAVSLETYKAIVETVKKVGSY